MLRCPKTGRILKGNIPFYKGKKLPIEIKEKSRHTQFKKGNTPANIKPDGSITIRKDKKDKRYYKWIKISDNNWELLHRYNWEKEIGPIPQGMNIVFKTEETLNCDIINLEMLTDAELLIRNRQPYLRRIREKKNPLNGNNVLDLIMDPNFDIMFGYGWNNER